MAEFTYNLTNTTAQMEQLRKNNLNPTLALGKGIGGQTVSTGNSSTGSVGMIDNKMSLADAQNMALLEAQRQNIKADTKLKEADAQNKIAEATKTGGVDTEESKKRMEFIASQIKKNEIDLNKGLEEIRALKNNNQITEETMNDTIVGIRHEMAGKELDNELKRSEIDLNEAQREAVQQVS